MLTTHAGAALSRFLTKVLASTVGLVLVLSCLVDARVGRMPRRLGLHLWCFGLLLALQASVCSTQRMQTAPSFVALSQDEGHDQWVPGRASCAPLSEQEQRLVQQREDEVRQEMTTKLNQVREHTT